MNINLSGQTAKADILRPYLVQFKTEIEKRYTIWQKLPPQKRKAWIAIADEKDPLFALFVDVVKYSRKWEVEDDE